MKIGILTQPLHNNYGGLLQAFALQKVLKEMGHEVLTINKIFKTIPVYIKLLSTAKRLILRFIFNKSTVIRTWPTKKEQTIISKNTSLFLKSNIRLTTPIVSEIKMAVLKHYSFDAYIVGSDQVWRPKYSPYLPHYFLDFLKNDNSVNRISYAASFGVDNWELNNKQTEKAKLLINKFDAISVREQSAIQLCKNYLNCEAELVLDPTLLLPKEEYIKHFKLDAISMQKDKLLIYILDKTTLKEEIIETSARELNLMPFKVMPENKFGEVGRKHIEETIYPPMEQWIKGFMEAEFIITDSFHGTIFSIIFNKPFIVIGNKCRGLSRFQSILQLFNLEDRLVLDNERLKLDTLIHSEINYLQINMELKKMKKKSIHFLSNALNNIN